MADRPLLGLGQSVAVGSLPGLRGPALRLFGKHALNATAPFRPRRPG